MAAEPLGGAGCEGRCGEGVDPGGALVCGGRQELEGLAAARHFDGEGAGVPAVYAHHQRRSGGAVLCRCLRVGAIGYTHFVGPETHVPLFDLRESLGQGNLITSCFFFRVMDDTEVMLSMDMDLAIVDVGCCCRFVRGPAMTGSAMPSV